jgi:SWI/SNF-related matrix-associated actin-dependent regulator of chromatin subfamily A protein 2/4
VKRLEKKAQERGKKEEDIEKNAWLYAVVKHSKDFYQFHHKSKKMLTKVSAAVMKRTEDAEKMKEVLAAKEAETRLRMLRENDEGAYRKLIAESKNTRLQHLLDQTDQYMDAMAARITSHQDESHQAEATKRKESETDVAFNVGEDDDDDDLATSDPNYHMADDVFGGRGGAATLPEDGELGEKPTNKYGAAHKIVEGVTAQADIMINGKLKEYQVEGLEWMLSLYNNKLNGILADEMGLGKTIQSIALITYLMEKKHNQGPFLVIVPLTTMSNWVLEFQKWAPTVKFIPYKGKPALRKQYGLQIKAGNFNVLLTTYEFVLKDKAVLSKVSWQYMIIDEGHRLKNKDSKLTKMLTQFYDAPRRLLLSGTPLQNNLPELWALLNFLLPEIFNSAENFDEWFSKPFASSGEDAARDQMLNEEEQLLVIQRLHKVLRPFLLRRLKKDVEKQLPDKVEHVLKCEMSQLQKKLYYFMNKNGVILTPEGAEVDAEQLAKAQSAGSTYMNNTAMQLKKICNHPFVFAGVDKGMMEHLSMDPDLEWAGPDLWRSAGKFELLTRVLPKMQASGHRVLMFCQYTSTINILEWFFKDLQIRYLRLDGGTKADDRGVLIAKFNAPDSPYDLFVLSTRAGGLGLNLQSADTVIIFDSDWNPHQDLQAQDRAHRIGQKNEVRVFRLLTINSIEEFVLETARFKLEMDDKVIQAGKYNAKSTDSESAEYLRQALAAHVGEEDNPDEEGAGDRDSELPPAEHLNRMLARSDEEYEQFQRLDNLQVLSEAGWRSEQRRSRLMEVQELPAWVMQTEAKVAFEARKHEMIDMSLGRDVNRRTRKDITYTEMSEREFNKAVENGNMEAFAELQNQRPGRKRARGEDDADYIANLAKRSARYVGAARTQISVTPTVKVLILAMQQAKDENGRLLQTLFQKDPCNQSKKFPSYGLHVSKPMWVTKIHDKRMKGRYKTIEKLRCDVKLIVDNSIVYRDAFPQDELSNQMVIDSADLLKLFDKAWVEETGGPEAPSDDEAAADGEEGGGGGRAGGGGGGGGDADSGAGAGDEAGAGAGAGEGHGPIVPGEVESESPTNGAGTGAGEEEVFSNFKEETSIDVAMFAAEAGTGGGPEPAAAAPMQQHDIYQLSDGPPLKIRINSLSQLPSRGGSSTDHLPLEEMLPEETMDQGLRLTIPM